MANPRRFELEDLVNRPGTYFNPQTEVVLIVDDSPEIDAEIFNMEVFEGAEWVLISDEVPVEEHVRDELIERFQARHHPNAVSGMGAGPSTNDTTTSTGATNNAICELDPIAMFTARSILFLRATSTATQCSAALPTIATTIAPMKNSLRPTFCAASAIAQTRIYDIPPTATPAMA